MTGLELPPDLQQRMQSAAHQQAAGQMAAQWRTAMGIEHNNVYDITIGDKIYTKVVLEEVVLAIGPTGVVPVAVKFYDRGVRQRKIVPWHAISEISLQE